VTSALQLENLTIAFGRGRNRVVAVQGVDLRVEPGEVVGLVGESGSGKSTIARAVVGLVQPAAGRVLVAGHNIRNSRRGRISRSELASLAQMVFQDPYSSLDPRMSVARTIDEALRYGRRGLSRAERQREVMRLLETVTLDGAYADRMPSQLSGGQRQRVAIARSLAVRPKLLIADEVTAALDVSVQAQILNLLRTIQRAEGLSMLFISHNLSMVRYLSDRIAVMYMGEIVEVGPSEELVRSPTHPYTKVLLAAVPKLAGDEVDEMWLPVGETADPRHPPQGCRFHPRCPVGPGIRSGRELCQTLDPREGASLRPHSTACHFPLKSDEPAPARAATHFDRADFSRRKS
jgi:peptide/nickel transport system ATP-binding protein